MLELVCLPWRERARDRARDLFRVERHAMRSVIRDLSADAVHAHWTYEYAWAAISSRRPALITAHDAPLTILRYHRDAYRVLRLVMAARVRIGAQLMSAVSPYAAGRWAREMLDPREIHVVPNIAPDFVDRAQASGEERRVVMIGTPDRRKNIAAGLTAFALARQADPHLRLRLIGPGLEPAAAIGAGAVPVEPGVDRLGQLSPDALHRELAGASVLLHPSLEETQGMVLLEAMRAGIPVIAGSRSGGVGWTLDDGKAGMLVDVASPAAMARALRTMLTDTQLAARYVRHGKRLLEERYSADVVSRAYVHLYERLPTAQV
ncbi:MAG: L-malate glycosyltransferase [Frankiales bacterium]|jgi:glycosyltransferase involved in cell wall biosynthesis|nr:L-malate glycosyltransferase [Frankiales bacterium]